MNSIPIAGQCDRQFAPLAKAFEKNFAEHADIGAALCVYQNGQKVVDLWGGFADGARSRPWQEDTLVNVWSTTKGMMSLCIARLNDQGLLDNNRPVADYWPQFAVNGKESVTVAQMFSHQAGLCGLLEPISEQTLLDTDKLADLLASQAPQWPVGSCSGYHAISIGPLADALVKRVTGQTLGQYFREQIAEPLNLDFHIGLASEHEGRVAEIVHDGEPFHGGYDTFNQYQRSALEYLPIRPGLANLSVWRKLGMPSAGGQGNARGVAQVYGALASDRCIDGVELVSEQALAAATSAQITSADLVLGVPVTWGIGFALNEGIYCYGPNANAFGHHGWGGSFGFADPQHKLGVGYTMNFMREAQGKLDPRAASLVEAIYASI